MGWSAWGGRRGVGRPVLRGPAPCILYPNSHPAVMRSMSSAPRALRLLAAAVLLYVPSGCYRYVPAEPLAPTAVPPGTGVRLYLTPQGMTALEPRLGPRTAAVIGR